MKFKDIESIIRNISNNLYTNINQEFYDYFVHISKRMQNINRRKIIESLRGINTSKYKGFSKVEDILGGMSRHIILNVHNTGRNIWQTIYVNEVDDNYFVVVTDITPDNKSAHFLCDGIDGIYNALTNLLDD